MTTIERGERLTSALAELMNAAIQFAAEMKATAIPNWRAGALSEAAIAYCNAVRNAGRNDTEEE